MARYAQVTIVVGKRHTGKTNKTLSIIYKAVNSGRKALIFDVTDEFGHYIYRPDQAPHSIKAIYLKDIPRFTAQTYPELVRIRPFWDDGTRMTIDDMQTALFQILNTYRDGILLIEDINKYISDNAPNDIIGSLATVRQAGIDLIAQYQMVGKAGNPKILGMANFIRLHKTQDQVERHADKFLDKTEIMAISEIMINKRYEWGVKNNVNDHTGKFFNVTIDLDAFKIKGIFTQKEAEAAITAYISDNEKRTISKVLNRKDKNGVKLYKSYSEAYAYVERNMLDTYFNF
jgi:hypothetical protein